MKSLFTSLLLLIIIISSCQKEYTGPRTLTAQAIDKTTNKPVPDTWLYLIANEKGTFNMFSHGDILEVKKSDGQGKAEFTFNYEENYTYEFYAINENGYFDSGYNFTFIDYKKTKGEVKVFIQPKGYIKLNVKNKYPEDGSDRIDIGVLIGGSSTPTLIGMDVDTTICCGEAEGNQTEKIYWWINKGGKPQQIDSLEIYLPAHDTTVINIDY